MAACSISPLASASEDLFERNTAWARAIARNVARTLPPSFDPGDLEQIAIIAMWKLCEKYDADNAKGTPFQAFAYMAVRGAVLMQCRRRSYREATCEPLADGMVCPRPNPEARIEMLREKKIEGQRFARQRSKVDIAIENLQPFDAFIVTRHYLEGMEAEELADMLGMDLKALGRRLSSVVRQLKKAVGA